WRGRGRRHGEGDQRPGSDPDLLPGRPRIRSALAPAVAGRLPSLSERLVPCYPAIHSASPTMARTAVATIVQGIRAFSPEGSPWRFRCIVLTASGLEAWYESLGPPKER